MHIYASIPTTPVWGVYLHRHTSMNYKLYARLSPSTSLDTNIWEWCYRQTSTKSPLISLQILRPFHRFTAGFWSTCPPGSLLSLQHLNTPQGCYLQVDLRLSHPDKQAEALRCCRAADVFSACLLWSACRDSGLDFGVNSGCEFLNSQYSRKRNRMLLLLLLLGGNWEEELR